MSIDMTLTFLFCGLFYELSQQRQRCTLQTGTTSLEDRGVTPSLVSMPYIKRDRTEQHGQAPNVFGDTDECFFLHCLQSSFSGSSRGSQKTDALVALLISCGAEGAAVGWG